MSRGEHQHFRLSWFRSLPCHHLDQAWRQTRRRFCHKNEVHHQTRRPETQRCCWQKVILGNAENGDPDICNSFCKKESQRWKKYGIEPPPKPRENQLTYRRNPRKYFPCQARSQDFYGWVRSVDYTDQRAPEALLTRGSGGMPPPGKFWKLSCLRLHFVRFEGEYDSNIGR